MEKQAEEFNPMNIDATQLLKDYKSQVANLEYAVKIKDIQLKNFQEFTKKLQEQNKSLQEQLNTSSEKDEESSNDEK